MTSIEATATGSPSPKRTLTDEVSERNGKRRKLHGRAFYESLGSPKIILAPMVDQSEFAWRMLTRSFLPPESSKSLLAYSPMFHSRLFNEDRKYRDQHFQPVRGPLPSPPDSYHQDEFNEGNCYLDGNPTIDRPLFVQFCTNSPNDFYEAARYVQGWCDAVDLNLGCPQGIAKKGHYGAFLQEDQDLICRLIRKLHDELDVPVTAKMRILDTKERSLAYAKRILDAGASIITVHGRQRDQKGHNTGLADWSAIRYLRNNLPPETVIFANGNILQHGDIERCLEETGVDGVMSAEGNLHDPSIFAEPPPVGQEGREYWRGGDGKGGYRVDAVMRRYMDIIYKYVLERPPPPRGPLFIPSDEQPTDDAQKTNGEKRSAEANGECEDNTPLRKKRKKDKNNGKQQQRETNPNLCAMQPHLFSLLRHFISVRHEVRDALAHSRAGDIEGFENVLRLVEIAVKEGILEYERSAKAESATTNGEQETAKDAHKPESESSEAAIARCQRPFWICQPYVRPLPKEAFEKGSMQLSKKDKARLAKEAELAKSTGLNPEGRVEVKDIGRDTQVEIPKEGVVCG
ncbi:FMN-linked oxidoreductase [Rhizodiscina lignyota]|uniref:tRNA-dihydrouridine(16/17) synthase [NAD(P)(+)] n=1 Tax=Rhizodiscina lignyota TaxID=1504668 RepID=A0A9P4M0Q4_9PEZI|nr:FMN-linked oxidoreductase [Rhizodiscina lignyota]